ncbi:MAG: LacI family DNA-binding transcriptional regulator [Phycisphaerae bacterium]
MSVSILDVALKADVSRMTVTRVMRQDGSVNAQTQDRVMRVMRQMGYVPSPAARAMRSKDKLRGTGALCFALIFGADTQLADGFFCDVARGAEQAASEHGLCPLQVHWQNTFEASWPRLQSVFSISSLCGAVLVGQFSGREIKNIQQHAKRVVVVDGPAPENLPVASVESDNISGCKLAIQHLLDRGVRRLLILTGPPDHYFSQATLSAVNYFRSHFERVDIANTDYTAQTAEAVIHKVWAKGRKYDGIFGNDELSLGALRALADLQVKVPQKVRVIGFDDIPHAAFSHPRLTTISIDKKQLGREAVLGLIEMVRGSHALEPVKKIIRAKLVIREST